MKMLRRTNKVLTPAILAFIAKNPGSHLYNVMSGFPDAPKKDIMNSLSALWHGRYVSRTTGAAKNPAGMPMFVYTVKVRGPIHKRRKTAVKLTDYASTVDASGVDIDKVHAAKPTGPSILDEAKAIIYGDREKTYGAPGKNLKMIGDLWAAYSGVPFTAEDVCNMMILLKVARLANDPKHRDSQIDLCGYAALMERVQK